MLPTQWHLGALLKHLPRVLFVILAAEAEKHPGLLLRPHEILQCNAGFIQADTVRTLFAANTGPERLVQIENNHLMTGPGERMKFASNGGGQRREKLCCVR